MTDSSLDDGDVARLLVRTIDLLKQVSGQLWFCGVITKAGTGHPVSQCRLLRVACSRRQ